MCRENGEEYTQVSFLESPAGRCACNICRENARRHPVLASPVEITTNSGMGCRFLVIGIHHVHHLSSKVPYYRLPEVLRDYPELCGIGRITILESIRCVKLVLWDERSQRLVTFCDARATPPPQL